MIVFFLSVLFFFNYLLVKSLCYLKKHKVNPHKTSINYSNIAIYLAIKYITHIGKTEKVQQNITNIVNELEIKNIKKKYNFVIQ